MNNVVQRKKIIFCCLACSIVMVTGIIVECALRSMGKMPAQIIKSDAFKIVGKLKILQSLYRSDAEGVYKVDQKYREENKDYINSDGFRGEEFRRNSDLNRRSILFLGDSFTWGLKAEPLTNSFVDIVRQRGYVVFNTGIPCAQPRQYAFLAKKYASTLRPDIVACMFYMGNDLCQSPPMVPYRDIFHHTNAGWLQAFDEKGNYMSAAEAYDYWVRSASILQRSVFFSSGMMEYIAAKTIIGAYVWGNFQQLKIFVRQFDKIGLVRKKKPQADTSEIVGHLENIRQAAEEFGARFMLFLIPEKPCEQNWQTKIEDNLYILGEFDPFYPDESLFKNSDYAMHGDIHFNNEGHRKYADFICEAISGNIKNIRE